MRFLALGALAQFTISVSALAVTEPRDNLVKARASAEDPSPTPEAQSQCPGYETYTPSEWQGYGQQAYHHYPPPGTGTCVEDSSSNNADGTTIHVSGDCIVINDLRFCENTESYHVGDDEITKHVQYATIYSKFDSGNTDPEVTPGCELLVQWPGAWADLDFTDDCLTDRTKEFSVCCTDDTTTTESVINPYA